MKSQSIRTKNNHLFFVMAIAALAICGLFASNLALAAGSSSYSDSKKETPKDKEMAAIEVALAQKDYDKSLSLLTSLAQTRPESADVWNLTGFSLRKLGRYDEAKTAYEKALSIDPNHTRALEYMGELYLSINQLDEAQKLLDRLNKLCSFNCKDRDALKKAIANYKKS